MKNQKKVNYFIGLDIGTNSIGYAATTENYDLIKYQQHPVWGVHLFDEAKLANERRVFRTTRRRLDRRQQRIQLLRELFSEAIIKKDPTFFHRIDASASKKDTTQLPSGVFADHYYNDSTYYAQYPTIHHLIKELIDSDKAHDVRLIYIACAWFLAHRGHFFSDVDKEKIDEIIHFSTVYNELENFVEDHGYTFSWKHRDCSQEKIGNILSASITKTEKLKKLTDHLQVKKMKSGEIVEDLQWFDELEFLKLLCGSKGKTIKLFPGSEYSDKDVSLDADDEKIAEILSELNDDDKSLLILMKKIFDWSVLADIIGECKNISSSKVKIYEKHKADLQQLKYIIKKYLSHQDYLEIFRASDKNNYPAYSGSGVQKKISREDFYKFLNAKLKKINCDDSNDSKIIEQIQQDIAAECFIPKQVTTDNRTIPYQLYWNELKTILNHAANYLPFLRERDKDGLSVQEKILSIMEFRIPYFVGPLNSTSQFAWFKRKAEGTIRPWNFDKKVDLDASEEAFIKQMTNKCTYLPDEPVLPKHSLLYQRFEVLNLINSIQVDGKPISVTCKQELYELFEKFNKITKKNDPAVPESKKSIS